MSAELQSLLEKIQTEGVAKADAEASRIVDEARSKAASIVAEAEKRRDALTAEGETAAKTFQERAEQAVRQAARDVVLGVSESVDQTLKRIMLSEVTQTLSPDFLKTFLVDLVRAYADSSDGRDGIEVQLAPEQVDALRDWLLANVRGQAASGGVTVRADREVTGGFRLSLADGRVSHDFTAQAIQSAMARLLRPALAKLLESGQA